MGNTGKAVFPRIIERIPGAINVPADRETRADGTFVAWYMPTVNADWTFRPADELRTLFARAGVTPDKRVITYCVLGGLSSHAWFVLTQLLGYPDVREYDRSWAEWGNVEGLPIERNREQAETKSRR
jgi:thiosulfate/3-mercaptopyruvate sulfurtransferase